MSTIGHMSPAVSLTCLCICFAHQATDLKTADIVATALPFCCHVAAANTATLLAMDLFDLV